MKFSIILIKCIIVLFLLSSSFKGIAQKDTLSFIIKDNTTQIGIPFVNIYSEALKIGGISNEKGLVTFVLDEKNVDNNFKLSSLGYEDKEVNLFDFSTKTDVKVKVFNMIPITVHLNEVTVSANSGKKKGELKSIGFAKKSKARFGSYFNVAGGQTALYFSNQENDEGFISSVRYFVKKSKFSKTTFRVRIYACDSMKKPDVDLLKKNLIITPEMDDEWIIVDLSSYHINIPQDGFFIAMEWLPVTQNLIYEIALKTKTLKRNGQVLGAVSQPFKKANLTWEKTINSDWKQRGSSIIGVKPVNRINAAIGANVRVYKKK